MKLGVSALVWADRIGHDNVVPIDKAHELGFGSIEIVEVNPDSFDVAAAEAALKRTGLTPIISGGPERGQRPGCGRPRSPWQRAGSAALLG